MQSSRIANDHAGTSRAVDATLPLTPPELNPGVESTLCCPACEYDLRGLATGQTACPECGTDVTDAGKKYRAVLAARRLRLSRWLFFTSPATALVPLAFGSFGVVEAVRWLAYLVLVWLWLSGCWCLHNEVPTPHWGDRCVQAVGGAVMAAFYFAMFWAGALVLCLCIAGLFRL